MADQQSLGVMNADPQEVWETLFAKALVLIGEIEKHGNADPIWHK